MEYEKGKVLEGIRILDLSQYLSGPYCTVLLADYGADVILVERPDFQIGSGPYLKGERIYTLSSNRGKRGITLDFRNPEDKEIFFKLVEQSDVVVENFRPGVVEKMGITYEDCKKRNPGIIYTAISGFGLTGPYKMKGAMDVVIQAMSGLMSMTGEPNGPATKIGPSISDMLTALFSTIAIMGALYHKQRTGEGQMIDMGMLDCSFASLENAVSNYCATGKIPTRVGNKHQTAVPFRSFKTSDGEIVIATSRNPIFVRLANALGHPEWPEDERYATTESRRLNAATLEAEIESITEKSTMSELQELLEAADIPVGVVNPIDRIVNDPQIADRNMVVELQHPVAGPYKVAGNPIKMTRTTPFNDRPAPTLGQHTAEVFKELLNMSDEDIAKILERHAAMKK